MRVLALVTAFLLPSVAVAAQPTIVDAVRVEQRLAQARASHDAAAERAALAELARMPWPMLAPATDQLLASERASLDPKVEQAWAVDRALPMLAGELKASDDVLKGVLSEIAKIAQIDPQRPTDMVRMDEARKAYAARQLAEAEARYASITQGSPLWPEALRERAWTLMLMDRPDDSLGATVALGAPYFPQEDHAEGRLLRATVLLSKCRFDEAREIVAALADAQIPELASGEALTTITAGTTPQGAVAQRAWVSPLVGRVRAALAASGDLAANPAARARRDALIRLGTRLYRSAFIAEADALRQLKVRALKVRYESFRQERTIYERGATLAAPRPATPQPLDDDDVAWRFDGTYWRDELGSYRYSAGDACPRSSGR